MKTALLDSSVWISYFAKDKHHQKAQAILQPLSENKMNILVPVIVYVEVFNALKRLNFTQMEIEEIKTIFLNSKDIKIICAEMDFWINSIEKYIQKVRLKSSDLIILAHHFEYKIDNFYTFDQKLHQEYLHFNI